jgi:hypothetical protein
MSPCWCSRVVAAVLVLSALLQQQLQQQKGEDISTSSSRVAAWFSTTPLFVAAAAAWSSTCPRRTTTTSTRRLHQEQKQQHTKSVLSSSSSRTRDHWLTPLRHQQLPETTAKRAWPLFLALSCSNNEQQQTADDDHDALSSFTASSAQAKASDTSRRYRAHFAGASVQADQGFFIVLRVPIQQSSDDKDDNENCQQQQQQGSSTSSSVSTVTTSNYFLPIWVCDDPNDRTAATSPEALTLLQLLAQVDMAGSVLPPNVLEQIVILTLEEGDECDDDDNENEQTRIRPVLLKRTRTLEEESLVQTVHDQIFSLQARQQQQQSGGRGSSNIDSNMATLYSECPSWLQSRIKLPVCTLDELVVDIVVSATTSSNSDTETTTSCSIADAAAAAATQMEFGLKVTSPDFGTFFLESSLASNSHSNSVVPCVSYTYRPQTSRAFLATALALRYKSPVFVSIPSSSSSSSSLLLTKQELQRQFPMYRSVSTLQERSNNVVTSIKRGFEVNQLQAAYQIAISRNDEPAQVKIRAKLDELDNMSELPTQADSEYGSMQ